MTYLVTLTIAMNIIIAFFNSLIAIRNSRIAIRNNRIMIKNELIADENFKITKDLRDLVNTNSDNIEKIRKNSSNTPFFG